MNAPGQPDAPAGPSVAFSPASDVAPPPALPFPEAVRHLRTALASGAPWPQALLEAMSLWTLPEESHDGRRYKYLIQGEAFD